MTKLKKLMNYLIAIIAIVILIILITKHNNSKPFVQQNEVIKSSQNSEIPSTMKSKFQNNVYPSND